MKSLFDFKGYYEALCAVVAARKVTWVQVGHQTGVSPSTLSRMANGQRPDAASLAALSAWAGMNPAEFVHTERPQSRFFIDHGVVHDRATGRHLGGMEPGAAAHLLAVLQELEGEPDSVRMPRWAARLLASEAGGSADDAGVRVRESGYLTAVYELLQISEQCRTPDILMERVLDLQRKVAAGVDSPDGAQR